MANGQGPEKTRKLVIVLFSGGLDSTVTLANALRSGHRVCPLFFCYGQRNQGLELTAAVNVVSWLKKHYSFIDDLLVQGVALPKVGGLTGDEELRKPESFEQTFDGRTNAYVPMRNLVFLSLAGAIAEANEAESIWIGSTYSDQTSPDTRDTFLAAVQVAMMLGSRIGAKEPIRIRAPYGELNRMVVVEDGMTWGLPLHLTRTCYSTQTKPCRECDACKQREKAFKDAREQDPSL